MLKGECTVNAHSPFFLCTVKAPTKRLSLLSGTVGTVWAMLRGIIVGIVLTIAALLVTGYAGIKAGAFPANADARPSGIEAWMARTSLGATIRRQAPSGDNPVAVSDASLNSGMKLYVANCAVCHGAADGKATNVAHGLYQRPPQLASFGVEDDPPGVVYWKIKHGIRLTGMPSFSQTLTDDQIWQITAFVQNMDHLPPAVDANWKSARVSETIAPASLQMHRRKGKPGSRPPPGD